MLGLSKSKVEPMDTRADLSSSPFAPHSRTFREPFADFAEFAWAFLVRSCLPGVACLGCLVNVEMNLPNPVLDPLGAHKLTVSIHLFQLHVQPTPLPLHPFFRAMVDTPGQASLAGTTLQGWQATKLQGRHLDQIRGAEGGRGFAKEAAFIRQAKASSKLQGQDLNKYPRVGGRRVRALLHLGGRLAQQQLRAPHVEGKGGCDI